MSWQDIVITTCMIAFSYALVPQVITGFKQKKKLISTQTASITSIGLFILSLVCLSLNLIFSAIIVLINATLWTTLLIQGILYR